MINQRLAKEILNYIYNRNLSATYEIIPFKEIGEVDDQQWKELLDSFQNADEIIGIIKNSYHQYSTHVYKRIKKLPSGLRRLGHLIDINNDESSFFCGRVQELNKMNIIRHKKIKNNILLIGEPGVGKTSLVEAFAQKHNIKNLFVVECAKLISNTEFRGSFENKVIELMDFAKGMDLILFFDEIHVLINLGKTTGGISITDMLKPYLLDKSICFIGATTSKEARQLLIDDAFKRRFTPVIISEPNTELLIEIKKRFENEILHEEMLSEKSATDVIEALQKYVTNQHFPDKFIDFLDYMYASKYIGKNFVKYQELLEDYISDQKAECSMLF